MRRVASWLLFPALLAVTTGSTWWWATQGVSSAAILGAVFLGSVLTVGVAERLLPFERRWNRSHGDLGTDAAYLPMTVVVNGAIEPAVTALAVLLGGWLSRSLGVGLWPADWPVPAQVVLGCVVVELFDYWAHRVMHEWPLLWRLHAIHHSAPRLYWLNATRAHPGEMLFRGTISLLPLGILGAGETILLLLAVLNIVVGLFQHANIDFRLGPLSWIFSVGELHRWHHSRELGEANSNYGNSYIVWDTVFGTRYRPRDRDTPAAVGLADMDAFPRTLGAQLLAPFRWHRLTAAD